MEEHNCLNCIYCEFQNGKGWVCSHEENEDYSYDIHENNDCRNFVEEEV